MTPTRCRLDMASTNYDVNCMIIEIPTCADLHKAKEIAN